jgi:phosphate/sulfate permease
MDKSEHEDLVKTLAELRDRKKYLWRAKQEHLSLMEEMLDGKWTEKTETNAIYHAKQIQLAFEGMNDVQKKIGHVLARLDKIRSN